MGTPVVGLIGVGILGRPVAEELLASGVELVVRDVVPDAVAGLAEMGAAVASSSAEVAERCAIVLAENEGARAVDVRMVRRNP